MPPPNDAYVPHELLGRLVGYRLYSVQFVMDYGQPRFDGPRDDLPVLNRDVLPIVETPTGLVVAGQPRSWPAVPAPRTRPPQVDRFPASPDHERRRPIVPNSDVRKQP